MKGRAFQYQSVWYTVVDWYDRETNRLFKDEYGNDRLTKGYRNMVAMEKAKGNHLPVDEEIVVAVSGNGVRAFHDTQVRKGQKHAT